MSTVCYNVVTAMIIQDMNWKGKPNVNREDERKSGTWWKKNRIRAHTKRRMERLKGKLIGGYEVTRDDRSTKVKETDVCSFISQSDFEKRLERLWQSQTLNYIRTEAACGADSCITARTQFSSLTPHNGSGLSCSVTLLNHGLYCTEQGWLIWSTGQKQKVQF